MSNGYKRCTRQRNIEMRTGAQWSILLLMMLAAVGVTAQYSTVARLWTRIPPGAVFDRLRLFLDNIGINNCFEYVEDHSTMLLKCLRAGKIVDAEVRIVTSDNYITGYI